MPPAPVTPAFAARSTSLLDGARTPGPDGPDRRRPRAIAARVRESAASGGESFQGCSVGRYQVLERVGGGGMGVVYKARDSNSTARSPSSSSSRGSTDDNSAAERFRLEARAIAALEHPNICTIHEIGETEDGQLFLAMPLYDGETLQDRIARGPLPSGRPSASQYRLRADWPRRTRAGSSIATSSRRTCWSPPTAW